MSPELKPIWNDGMGFNYSFMEPIKQEKELKNTSRTVSVIEVRLMCLRSCIT